MKQLLTDVCVDATLENISILRKSITNVLEKLELNRKATNAIQLVFSEVASNFIEHSPSIIKLIIKLYYSRSSIELQVAEFGTKNNQEILCEWLHAVNTLKDLPKSPLDVFDLDRSGGRGAALTAELVNKIEYTSQKYQVGGKTVPIYGFTISWDIDAPCKRKHILIVDDDRSLAKLYESYLLPTYNVTCAQSVESALALIDGTPFDLILSDIHMPFYNGIEFREKVSVHNRAMNIPFIFMSGDHDADKHQALSNLGIDDFLIKPIVKVELTSRITRTITRVQQLNQLTDLLHTQSITQSLLPNIPSDLHSWRIKAISKGPNCGGGDLLIVKRQGNATLLIVADLMGHDIAAKFFSHAYLGYMRGVLCASSPEPEEFLQLLSNALYEDQLLSQSLCTCCAIKFDDNGMIRVASAGHPAPMIINQKQAITIQVEGMLPGLMPNIVYASKEYRLKKGERIAVFTDGFIDPSIRSDLTEEANSEENEILRALVQSVNMPLQVSLESVFSVLKCINGDEILDDTLLVLAEPISNMDEPL